MNLTKYRALPGYWPPRWNIDKTNPFYNGLIGYYRFDEGVGTTLYNHADSTLIGNLSLSSFTMTGKTSNWSATEFGGGLAFDGSLDRVTNSTSHTMTYTDNLTICAWYTPTVIDNSARVVGKRGNGNGTFMPMLLVNCANISGCNVWEAGTAAVTWMKPNDLYFGVGVWDGTKGEVRHYLNGVYCGVWVYSPNTTTSSNGEWTIGCRRRNSTYEGYFNGTVSEVRMYNRVLTQNEITALYEYPLNDTPDLTMVNELITHKYRIK